MKKLIQISRFWILEMEKLFLFGVGFSLIWPVFLNYLSYGSAVFDIVVFKSYFIAISFCYAVCGPAVAISTRAGIVISLNGRRKDIFKGMCISDIVYLLQCVTVYLAVLWLWNKMSGFNLLLFFEALLIAQGIGYVQGYISKKCGRAAGTIIYVIVFGIGAAILVWAEPIELCSWIWHIFVVAVHGAGRILQRNLICNYEMKS